ncbi:MAG TPA: DUF2652 domain-containing protein [Chitinophagaceae bacterium]|nr:DUF2652 domain-containing protein [Chitinophagaceae bacterium]
MESRGLLFIPDISGFTRFVNETEIDHSRMIIQELLEILINANTVGLEVSEIEGDAILFYKFGDPPPLEELYKQVENMFIAFHRNLNAYDNRRYCQCKSCMSAINLSLKVVTHYGEFTGYNVKTFNKLIGKDVIVAHQLLKNDIPQHEYWLVTQSLLQNHPPTGFANWMKWNKSIKRTESGEIPFHYTQLSQLRDSIPPELPPKPDLSNKVKVISLSQQYDADIITLFHAIGDFHYRHLWRDGVKRVEEVNHYLPRVGMRCRCVLENEEIITNSSSYLYQSDRIEFGETEEKNSNITQYTLEKKGDDKTLLTIDYYLPKNLLRQILFFLNEKKKLEKSLRKSMANATGLVKELYARRLKLVE